MASYHAVFESPLGHLIITAGDSGVTEILFVDEIPAEFNCSSHPLISATLQQLEEYFQGNRQQFELSLQPQGTPFQQAVWHQLRQLPYGETASYGEIANRIGNPDASRAVGAANGRNPIAIVVPCHRVIGSNGSLTGYAGGMARKQWLLAHEQRYAGKEFALTGNG